MIEEDGDTEGVGQDDSRKYARVPAKFAVDFKESEQAAKALRAYSLNFGAGGLCLKTTRDYAVGNRLTLSMTVEGQALTIEGVVAWLRPGKAIGVRFENISPEVRAKLEALVEVIKAK